MNCGRNNLVLEKAEAFALRIVKMYQWLSDRGERVMSKQVLRSGTSVGANITEGHFPMTPISSPSCWTVIK